MKAKYKGTCAHCNGAVFPGEEISWSRKQRGVVYHMVCVDKVPLEEIKAAPIDDDKKKAFFEVLATSIMPYVDARLDIALENIKPDVEPQFDKMTVVEWVKEMLPDMLPPPIVTHRVEIQSKGEVPVIVENAHPMLADLIKLLGVGKHVYVYGPPGSGKSTGLAHAFQALSREHHVVSLNPGLPPSAIFGFRDANGKYNGTPFRLAYELGQGIIFDELDNASAHLQANLNGALGNERGNFADGNVARHARFLCGATGNTNGIGGSRAFPDRRPMDSAFRDRFVFLEWGYDEGWERSVAQAFGAHANKWADWVFTARTYCQANHPTVHVTPRATFDGTALLALFPVERVADMVAFKGVENDIKAQILHKAPLPEVA